MTDAICLCGHLAGMHDGMCTVEHEGWMCPCQGFRGLDAAVPAPDSAVDHPSHYNAHPSGVECIDVVEHMSFNVGNAIKYLWRADHKGAAVEDLKKAAWYVAREIERRSK